MRARRLERSAGTTGLGHRRSRPRPRACGRRTNLKRGPAPTLGRNPLRRRRAAALRARSAGAGLKGEVVLASDDDVFARRNHRRPRLFIRTTRRRPLALVAPATRGRAAAAPARGRGALVARRWKPGPAKMAGLRDRCGMAVEAGLTPQKALAAVLAWPWSGSDLRLPARDVFVVGATFTRRVLRAARQEVRRPPTLGARPRAPAPCATEAAERPRRRRLVRPQAAHRSRSAYNKTRFYASKRVLGQKKKMSGSTAARAPTWRNPPTSSLPPATGTPPAAGTCPRSQATSRAAWLATRRARCQQQRR